MIFHLNISVVLQTQTRTTHETVSRSTLNLMGFENTALYEASLRNLSLTLRLFSSNKL